MFSDKKKPDQSSISEVIESERCAYLIASEGLFLFRSEPVNESQKLRKTAEKYFYPIFSRLSAKYS